MSESFPTPAQRPWYLVGLPGSGKTKVGRLLADFFAVPHIDTDLEVEKSSGQAISTIFAEEGEAAFRAREADAIAATLGSPGIISLGGGAVETQAVRDLLAGQTVIWIDAHHSELLRRIRRSDKRPLLRDRPSQVLTQLRQRRGPLFEEVASFRVTSTSASPTVVVREILRKVVDWDYAEVHGTHRYKVVTGKGTSCLVGAYIPPEATRAFVVGAQGVKDKIREVAEALEERGLTVTIFSHRDGEKAKDLPTVAAAWDALGKAKIGRRDLVVTVGGGVTTDLGGFLAATWLRGVGVLHIPTTLLAMVDAAVGGKTGINTAAGKNLVGAFHDPLAVLVDLSTLATLPQEEYAAGLAEAIKTGFIRDEVIVEDVENHPEVRDVEWATGEGMSVLADIVRRSIAVKAAVVSEDRLEGGLREILNYGHTMGHAIERAEDYTMRHGEAVAIGAVFASHLARELGYAQDDLVERHERLFAMVGLPIRYQGSLETLMRGITSDKKVRAGAVRFVLLEDQGVTIVRPVDPQTVQKVAEDLGMDRRDE